MGKSKFQIGMLVKFQKTSIEINSSIGEITGILTEKDRRSYIVTVDEIDERVIESDIVMAYRQVSSRSKPKKPRSDKHKFDVELKGL